MKFVPTEKILRRRLLDKRRRRLARSAESAAAQMALAAAGFMALGTSAFAATGTIGAQVQNIAQEFSTSGGFAASTAMYVGALITFVAGAWYLWQSRQPENRESGKVAAGVAGLVLTGLLVTGGNWIQKAANTATGANATITDTSAAVTFQ